ncbi:type II secretion system F family protein (plasmid) [Skermanella rosea]|uniref:type II secretion system F family protein n=1 Tax=Skermanella rosea TaxID=1817965 RepID=UPI0019338E95|nr:type II secretion system F family protein [Skermanella rosea]UEM07193.1 type II secretion system F family protein [Skermanella rosea]
MPNFRFKAVTAEGKVVEGDIDAPSRSAVIEHLRRQGSLAIRAEEGSARRSRPGLRGQRKGTKDLLPFTRELATLLRAEVPLDRALALVSELTDRPAFRDLTVRVLDRVRGGASFADALQAQGDVFPRVYVGMVRAGEAGGSLKTVLAQVAEMLARRQALEETVRQALQYPIFVLVTAFVSVILILTLIIPEFRTLFDAAGAALPLSTRIILWLSDFLRTWWLALGLGCCSAVLALSWAMRSPAFRRSRDALALRLPLVGGLIARIEAVRFSRTLGTLLVNGVSLLAALAMTIETIGNGAVAGKLAGVERHLKKGEGLAEPLSRAGVFPPMVIHLVRIGEESGQLEEMLGRIAEIYDEEVKRSIQRVLGLLVPVITVLLGIVVAGIIASVFSAILGSYNVAF